jgi:hypothetical protein
MANYSPFEVGYSFGFLVWALAIGGGMTDRVQVDSIDALKVFRVAVVKFAETCNVSMNDVESDFGRMMNWLETEQLSHWQTEIRKRTELLSRAKEALRMKKVFKDSSGRSPSAVDEEKAVRIAQIRLEEAEQKLLNVKKYTRVLQKEVQSYKGSVQRFMTTLQSDVPAALAMLDKMIDSLEKYVELAPADKTPTAPPPETTEPTEESGL